VSFASGSDHVKQIGLDTDEGSARFKAAFGGELRPACGSEEKVRADERVFRHDQNIKPTEQRQHSEIRNDFVFAGRALSSALRGPKPGATPQTSKSSGSYY
jgi:hypothetical protein